MRILRRGADDLAGTWKFLVRSNEWTVRLERVGGLPDEYAGDGQRDTPNEDGRLVEARVGALLGKRDLKVWVGPGIVVCDAPFSSTKPIVGKCRVALGEGEPGPFRAVRVP